MNVNVAQSQSSALVTLQETFRPINERLGLDLQGASTTAVVERKQGGICLFEIKGVEGMWWGGVNGSKILDDVRTHFLNAR